MNFIAPVIIAAFILSSCAVFRNYHLPAFENTPVDSSGERLRLFYQFKAANKREDEELKNPTVHKEWLSARKQEFRDILQDDGSFEVLEVAGGEDITLTVYMWEWGNPGAEFGAMLTGFSLYTIPSWATIHVEVRAEVIQPDGSIRQYNLQDSATLVQWLPMIFVYPFKPVGELADLRRNLYQHLIWQIEQDWIQEPALGAG